METPAVSLASPGDSWSETGSRETTFGLMAKLQCVRELLCIEPYHVVACQSSVLSVGAHPWWNVL